MSEWRFELEDVGENGEDEGSPDEHVEPGSPSLENAIFVALGVVTTLLILVLVATG